MNTKFYPLLFYPIFKDRIWGGEKLKTQFNKPIPSDSIGESWELSTVKDNVSIISNGIFKGRTISAIIEEFPNEIMGTAVHKQFGTQFPLLFKFLDAKKDLSIQVHPNDELAQKRHNSFGKTEMWYIIQTDEKARIILGFKEDSSKEEYLHHLNNKNLESILDSITVKEGDAFFLETGTVHAIGAGLMIAEIQQTSDITYRLYDYDRKDANGSTRELHVDSALEAINYHKIETQRLYTKNTDQINKMVDCPYFTTNFIPLKNHIDIQKSGVSFTVYMCVEGTFDITFQKQKYSYKKGDTILIPAAIHEFVLSGNASILEIYIS